MLDPASVSQSSWDLSRDLSAYLAAALSTVCGFVLYLFRGDIKELGKKISKLEEDCSPVADVKELGEKVYRLEREFSPIADVKELEQKVDKLEADRSAIAVMAEQIQGLAKALEESTTRMEQHHVDNLATAKLDREETTRWRVDTMTPMIQQLVADNLLNKERIEQLQHSRRRK